MLSDEEMRRELKEANETGKYRLYRSAEKLDTMDHKELLDCYMSMRNYLSDAATHDQY